MKDRLSKTDQSSESTKWPSLDDETASASQSQINFPTVPNHLNPNSEGQKVVAADSPTEHSIETADVSINVESDDKEPLLK